MLLLVMAFGVTLAQDRYDEPVVQEADIAAVLSTIAAARDNVFALLPDLQGPVVAGLAHLASHRHVYLIISEPSRGNEARALLASGVKVRVIPGALPFSVIVIDYRTVIVGDFDQERIQIIRSDTDELFVVGQLRAAWQAATPYEGAP
jgi:hypothetical protein